MILNNQQQKTLRHLKHYQDIVDPQKIVEFCRGKLALPHKKTGSSRTDTRVHSVTHYKGIIEYFSS